MKILISILFFFSITYANGQYFNRPKNENIESFIIRIIPDSMEIAHPVIKSNIWGDSIFITFWGWNKYYLEEFEKIKGYVFQHIGNNQYLRFDINSISENGGFPKIESVFYANADSDNYKELLIIVSRKFIHKGAGAEGRWYEILAYDDIKTTKNKELIFLSHIRDMLIGGCDCIYEEGSRIDGLTEEFAKLKTANAVKLKLKELGY